MMCAIQKNGMSLAALLSPWLEVDDCDISGIASDSRQVAVGYLFIAWEAQGEHGGKYIQQAIANGAVAILLGVNDSADAKQYLSTVSDVPVFVVSANNLTIGEVAARYYDTPSLKLKLTGITGTNGKTSCSHYLAQLRQGLCAVVGTLGNGLPDALQNTQNTTPGPIDLQALLNDFVQQKITSVAMEVSSHALDQQRVSGCHFESAIFTNLTQDHLDYHGDMASYANTKMKLFQLADLNVAVINLNDAFAPQLINALPESCNLISYGINIKKPDDGLYLSAVNVQAVSSGTEFTLNSSWGSVPVSLPLFGDFNVQNILAVMAVLLNENVAFDDLLKRVSLVKAVAGRMEVFTNTKGADVVVDYAHTPDALEQSLMTLRKHYSGRLICIFGCGGDRDKDKRPIMGRIAEQLSDKVILVDDNPRYEDPEQIIADIQHGMTHLDKVNVIRDRSEAILSQLAQSTSNDVILLAGKGHESYQQLGDIKKYYSDRETVQQLLGETR